MNKYLHPFAKISILIIFSSACSPKEKISKNEFTLKEVNDGFQNVMTLKFPLEIDSLIWITLIDGNADGKFYTSNDTEADKNAPDYMRIDNKKTSQFSSGILKDSTLLEFNKTKYLITIDTKGRKGSIQQLEQINKQVDISINNKLPDFKIQSYIGKKDVALSNVINKNYKYTIFKNWAPFCEPCIKQIKEINVDSFRINNIDLIYLIDSSYVEDIDKYFKDSKLMETIYLCDYKQIDNELHFNGYPFSILVSKEGEYQKYISFASPKSIIDKVATKTIYK